MRFVWKKNDDSVEIDTEKSTDRAAAKYLLENFANILNFPVDNLLSSLEAFRWIRRMSGDSRQLAEIRSYLKKGIELRWVNLTRLRTNRDTVADIAIKKLENTVADEAMKRELGLLKELETNSGSEILIVDEPKDVVNRAISLLIDSVVSSAGIPAAVRTVYEVAPKVMASPSGNDEVRPLKRQRLETGAGSFRGGATTETTSHPSLTYILHDKNQEGVCGNFRRVRGWKVNNPRKGVIIQRVERTFDVLCLDGAVKLVGDDLDHYVEDPNSSVHATSNQYWELWTVDPDGTVSDGGTDTFGLCSIIPGENSDNTTRGTFTIAGEASFYEFAGHPEALGFAKGEEEHVAGGLYYRDDDPTFDLAASGALQHGDPVSYTIQCKWDSSDGSVHARDPDFFLAASDFEKEASEATGDESESSDEEPKAERVEAEELEEVEEPEEQEAGSTPTRNVAVQKSTFNFSRIYHKKDGTAFANAGPERPSEH